MVEQDLSFELLVNSCEIKVLYIKENKKFSDEQKYMIN